MTEPLNASLPLQAFQNGVKDAVVPGTFNFLDIRIHDGFPQANAKWLAQITSATPTEGVSAWHSGNESTGKWVNLVTIYENDVSVPLIHRVDLCDHIVATWKYDLCAQFRKENIVMF